MSGQRRRQSPVLGRSVSFFSPGGGAVSGGFSASASRSRATSASGPLIRSEDSCYIRRPAGIIVPARGSGHTSPKAPARVTVTPCSTIGKTLAGASGWYEALRQGWFWVSYHSPVALVVQTENPRPLHDHFPPSLVKENDPCLSATIFVRR